MYFLFYFNLFLFTLATSSQDDLVKTLSSTKWLCANQNCSEPIAAGHGLSNYRGNHLAEVDFNKNDKLFILGKPSKAKPDNKDWWLVVAGSKKGVAPIRLVQEERVIINVASQVEATVDFSSYSNPNQDKAETDQKTDSPSPSSAVDSTTVPSYEPREDVAAEVIADVSAEETLTIPPTNVNPTFEGNSAHFNESNNIPKAEEMSGSEIDNSTQTNHTVPADNNTDEETSAVKNGNFYQTHYKTTQENDEHTMPTGPTDTPIDSSTNQIQTADKLSTPISTTQALKTTESKLPVDASTDIPKDPMNHSNETTNTIPIEKENLTDPNPIANEIKTENDTNQIADGKNDRNSMVNGSEIVNNLKPTGDESESMMETKATFNEKAPETVADPSATAPVLETASPLATAANTGAQAADPVSVGAIESGAVHTINDSLSSNPNEQTFENNNETAGIAQPYPLEPQNALPNLLEAAEEIPATTLPNQVLPLDAAKEIPATTLPHQVLPLDAAKEIPATTIPNQVLPLDAAKEIPATTLPNQVLPLDAAKEIPATTLPNQVLPMDAAKEVPVATPTPVPNPLSINPSTLYHSQPLYYNYHSNVYYHHTYTPEKIVSSERPMSENQTDNPTVSDPLVADELETDVESPELPTTVSNEVQSELPTGVTNEVQSELPTGVTNEVQPELPTGVTNEVQSELPTGVTNEVQPELPTGVTNEVQPELPTGVTNEVLPELPVSEQKEFEDESIKHFPDSDKIEGNIQDESSSSSLPFPYDDYYKGPVDNVAEEGGNWFSGFSSVMDSIKDMFAKSDVPVVDEDSSTVATEEMGPASGGSGASHSISGTDMNCENDPYCSQFKDDISIDDDDNNGNISKMFEGSFIPDISLQTLACLIITSIVVLLFSLGHYYLENLKQDTALAAKINTVSTELFFAQKELATIEEQYQRANESYQRLLSENSNSGAAIEEMRRELEESQREKKGLENEVKRMESEIESLIEEGDEMHRMLAESFNEEERTKSLLANISDLKGVLAERLQEIVSLTGQLDKEKQEVELLTISLKKSDEQKEATEEKLAKVLNEADSNTFTVTKEFEEKISTLERIIEERSLERTNFEKQICELNGTCEALMVEKELAEKALKKAHGVSSGKGLSEWLEVKQIRTDFLSVQKEVEKLKKALEESNQQTAFLEAKEKELYNEIEAVNNKYESAEKDKIEALTKLQVLSNYFTEKEIQLQEELGTKEAQWLQKQSEDHTIYEQMRSLREENLSYKAQNEALKKEILDQETSFKIQIANEEQKAQENWINLRHTERRLKEVQMEASHLRSRLTALETHPDSLEDKHKSLDLVNGDASMGAASPPFMLYPPPDFIPPPPLVSPSRPPPLGRLSSPSPPLTPPAPLSPFEYYPPPPSSPPHRVHKPQPREPHRKQKDSQSSNHSSESTDKSVRRGKR